VSSASQEIPHILWYSDVHCCFYIVRSLHHSSVSAILTNQQTNKCYNCYMIHNNMNFKLLHVLDLTSPSLGSTLIFVVYKTVTKFSVLLTKFSVLLHDLDSKILFPAYLLYHSTLSISDTSTRCSSLLVLFCSCHSLCYIILYFNLSIEFNIIYNLLLPCILKILYATYIQSTRKNPTSSSTYATDQNIVLVTILYNNNQCTT